MPGVERAFAAWQARPHDCRPLVMMDFDGTLVSHVSHPVLDGIADTVNANDNCPHNPFGTDKGCGGKTPAGTLGGDVLIDVIVK